MAKQPINNGKVVERSYEDYRNNQYLVNRRYQRKLVWELEEKQAFIDSLANGYPVPLFLFAKCVYKGQDRSEIIDGMQRLNAVFSFIENDYPAANGEYFDLSTIPYPIKRQCWRSSPHGRALQTLSISRTMALVVLALTVPDF